MNAFSNRIGAKNEPVVTPAWSGLINQVQHLAQFGGSIQVVGGQRGAGKTTFLRLLVAHSDEPVIHYRVPTNCSAQALFRALLQKLGLRPTEEAGAGELIASLRGFAQSLERDQTRMIIALDDAHLLGASELAALVSVLQGYTGSGFGLHFLLFGEPGLAERIDQLHLVDITVHDALIPSLSPSELRELLQAYARERDLPYQLKLDQLQSIWARSSGMPGPALAILMQEEPQRAAGANRLSMNGWPVGHFAALALLAIVLVWALLVRNPEDLSEIEADTGSPGYQSPQSASAPDPNGSAAGAGGEREDLALDAANDRSEPAAMDQVSAEASAAAETPLASEMTRPEAEASAASADSGPVLEPTSTDIGETNASDASVETPSQVTQGAAETASDSTAGSPAAEQQRGAEMTDAQTMQAEAADASEPALDSNKVSQDRLTESQRQPNASRDVAATSPSEQWLKASQQRLNTLAGNGYVLQLMALSQLDGLYDFAQQQPNRASLRVYAARRNGKLLYILVEGYYADKASASAAIANLPPSQRKGGPWPKPLESIKREIGAIGGI